jgi:Protein of unknown function (DUF3187)
MYSRRSYRSGSRRSRTFLALLPLAAAPALAAPFSTRDQNPLLAGYGIPAPLPARIVSAEHWQLATELNWGSTAVMQRAAAERLTLDAETRELRLLLQRGLNELFAVQLQLPYRYTGAGSLDPFIGSWHELFDLPEGARNRLPDDQIAISYRRDGRSLLERSESMSGLGDVSAALGYQLGSSASAAAAIWLSLKLPTGAASELTGSGAADASLAIAGEHRFAERWELFGQASAAWLGAGEILPAQQRSIVYSGMVSVGWQAFTPLQLKLQLDAHSAVFDDTRLDILGAAVVLTAGGELRLESGWVLDIGVSEDILVETSPDVVFVFGLSRGW